MTTTASDPTDSDTAGRDRSRGRQDMFAALSNKNYRRYAIGQSISLVGSWIQMVAQSWLVLLLTGSGTDLGIAVALQMVPVLVLGPYAGVVVDRVDKRRLMIMLQAMMGILALVLGVLTLTHVVTVWEVYLLAVALGFNNCFENPARQSFVREMVGRKHLHNAVSLNSVTVNVARALGPAVAGIMIAAGGVGLCFLINAATFVAVIVSLVCLDLTSIAAPAPMPRARGQMREGFSYVRRTPSLLVPLTMMALVGCLAYEYQVVLPIVAKQTFHGGSQAYGFVTASMGVGAVFGGLYAAARGRPGLPSLIRSLTLFGAMLGLAALAPNLACELVALALAGGVSVYCLSCANSSLQLAAEPSMQGRVMALWSVALLGSTPIGGPIAGAVCQAFGGRGGLALGAFACFGAAVIGIVMPRRSSSRSS